MSWLYVFIGGGAGAVCRFFIGQLLGNSTGFPTATLVANLVGCLLIGIVSAVLFQQDQKLQLLLMIGFLGGFTTFSTYGLDMMKMIDGSAWKNLVLYVLMSNVGGLVLVILGHKITQGLIH